MRKVKRTYNIAEAETEQEIDISEVFKVNERGYNRMQILHGGFNGNIFVERYH